MLSEQVLSKLAELKLVVSAHVGPGLVLSEEVELKLVLLVQVEPE